MREYDMPHDRFLFTGPVPNDDLAAFYRHADVYISLSEHEGFCVPLLESMAAGVPVLAYGEAAVPETMGGAGVVFNPKDLDSPPNGSACSPTTRTSARRMMAGQRERLADFGDDRIGARAGRPHCGVLLMPSSPIATPAAESTREDRLSSSSATAPISSAAPSTTAG